MKTNVIIMINVCLVLCAACSDAFTDKGDVEQTVMLKTNSAVRVQGIKIGGDKPRTLEVIVALYDGGAGIVLRENGETTVSISYDDGGIRLVGTTTGEPGQSKMVLDKDGDGLPEKLIRFESSRTNVFLIENVLKN